MPPTSDRPAQGIDDLVLRAVFVPDGEDAPPEFMAIDPMMISVTLDPATGEITGGDAGVSLDGGIPAEWVPDDTEEADGSDSASDSAAGSHATTRGVMDASGGGNRRSQSGSQNVRGEGSGGTGEDGSNRTRFNQGSRGTFTGNGPTIFAAQAKPGGRAGALSEERELTGEPVNPAVETRPTNPAVETRPANPAVETRPANPAAAMPDP